MRNLHLWFAAGLGILIGAFACAVLQTALSESLWLDELHTSWAISGEWQEIATRAAAGNQTPLYFWLVAAVSQTLGYPNGHQSEWLLRLPSIVAWLLAVGLVAWQIQSKILPNDSRKWSFAIGIVAWVAVDRLQWFFASEARPYACVQLVSLAGWCCIEAIVREAWRTDGGQGADSSPMRSGQPKIRVLVVAWCLLSIINIYLHLTAALPVLFQWLTACGMVAWSHARARRQPQAKNSSILVATDAVANPSAKPAKFQALWILAGVVVGLALLPILQLAFPVWQRRGQWATFASDVSFYRASSMFPFIPVLLGVFVGCVLDRLLPRSNSPKFKIATHVRLLWWVAMLGPWLTAWALTALGIAPMFHQRFVFASALPLFVVGAIELISCRHWISRWLTCGGVAIAILFSQGSLSIWHAGYLVGNLRGEDWRAATEWVRSQRLAGEPLLCSSGLIEANSSSTYPHRLPLEPAFAEYLAFPLLGIYRVAEPEQQTATNTTQRSLQAEETPQASQQVTPLLGDHRQWAAQVGERVGADTSRQLRMWLFYRGAPGRLKTKLGEFQSDLRTNSLEFAASEPERFGSVFVVELKRVR
ncbi:MAG: hypothetical protein SFV81_02470 [Pirellulaceae bacterium]|nr:hypothetical protein [Pirellulaceae bacterium]